MIDPADSVLAALARDHRRDRACAELVMQQLEDGATPPVRIGLDGLAALLADGPDDFHHLLERRLFRCAWRRGGVSPPGGFHLEHLHAERAACRDGALGADGLLLLARFVRAQIDAEETQLFPYLRAHLAREDWSAFAEELDAWRSVAGVLTSRAQRATAAWAAITGVAHADEIRYGHRATDGRLSRLLARQRTLDP